MSTLNPIETPEGFSKLFSFVNRKPSQNPLPNFKNVGIRNNEM